jgi:beta-galactosidase/beta-glucuronidase
MGLPRPEYPRPILTREQWLNLNGHWHYEADPLNVGLNERWYLGRDYSAQILVPYPIESEASEVHNLTPGPVHWYERCFEVPADWQQQTLLHIGACDHWARVFVNGYEVGQHRGGYGPTNLDITHALVEGNNRLTVRVADDISWTQPRGKQAGTTKWPIDYDTVTGIWQTVWLEPVAPTHIEALHSEFDLATGNLQICVEANQQTDGELKVVVKVDGAIVASGQKAFEHRAEAKLVLNIDQPQLWSPQSPTLYELELTVTGTDGSVDEVRSYVGLRQIKADGGGLYLNNEPLYIRGVLDQGYFPGGWYTPLDDEAIRQDVQLTLDLGFNCARKHQKIEDPRYLYWADQLGLLVWEEMPSGRVFSNELVMSLTREWLEILRRDRQHPCIIAWVPFNESWGIWNQTSRPEQRAFADSIVNLTHALDQSRWVVGNDGWEYSSGDLWTLHIYEGESLTLAERLDRVIEDPQASLNSGDKVGALPGANVEGLPILLTECGGVGFARGELAGDEFSYGDFPKTLEEFEVRFQTVADTVSNANKLTGFVWTQLTDVQQEINGVLYFDRTAKLPIDKIRTIIEGIGR